MRKLIVLAGLAVVPHLMGQATMGQTTFALAVNATTSTVQLASVTGVQAGVTILFADREAMNVISLVGFQATVQRGSGGQAGTHTTTATVWVGPPNYYGQFDPAGACVRNQIPALPRVIIPTGNVFDCTGGTWVLVTGGSGVTSFNGRTGAVSPASGDYTAAEVTNAASKSAANAFSTGLQDFSAASFKPSLKTVATLPSAAASTNLVFMVTDGQSASDCTMGGGTTRAQCASDGSSWLALGGGSIAPCTITTGMNCPSFSANDATKSGALFMQGLSSGNAAWVVADVAGTSVGYVMPTTNPTGTGQVLADNGPTTCPTLGVTVSSCRALIWATPSAGGGGFVGSCGDSGNVTQTGSDIDMCTISTVSALAAGQCYTFTGLAEAAVDYQVFVYVDATLVSTPVSNNNTWGGYFVTWQTAYCNNAGVQNAQSLLPILAGFQNSGYAYGVGPIAFLAEASGAYPKTPTGVDWSTTHTITVKMNAASGNGRLYYFKVN